MGWDSDREDMDDITYYSNTENNVQPPAKRQKPEIIIEINRKDVTKPSSFVQKTNQKINKSSLKASGQRKSNNTTVRFEPLVQTHSVSNDENSSPNENYGIFNENRSMPQKSRVKKGKKSTKYTRRTCNKDLRFFHTSIPLDSYVKFLAKYANGTFPIWKPVWKH